MSISDALSYALRRENLFKILPLAIFFSLFAFLTSAVTNVAVLFGAGLMALLLGIAMVGYYITIIERAQTDSNLVDLNLNRDLGRGCMSSLASLVYILPIVILMMTIPFIASPVIAVQYMYEASTLSTLYLVVLAVLFLLLIPLSFMTGFALLVGFNRYAAEDSQALFEIGRNFGIAWKNAGKGIRLLLSSFVIAIINMIVTMVITLPLNMLFPQAFLPVLARSTFDWVIFALVSVVSYTITLIFVVAQYHLVAQYGNALDIAGGPRKRGQDEGNTGKAVFTAMSVLAVLILGAVAVMMVLAISGPTIESVF